MRITIAGLLALVLEKSWATPRAFVTLRAAI
jgi:hypothetical protein